MTKVITVLLALLVSACASKDPLIRSAEQAKENRADEVARVLKKRPNWYEKGCVQSNEIACAMAIGESNDIQASEDIALELAKGKICDTAGGTVDKVTKTFRTQEGTNAIVTSKTAIRSVCDEVDVSGLVVGNKEVIALNDKFLTYIEVKIMLEGNPIRDRKEQARLKAINEAEGEELLRDLDN